MWGIDRRTLQNIDWVLLLFCALLLGIGFVNLLSSTHAEGGLSGEARRQLGAIGLGAALAIAAASFDYRHFERLALPLFAGSLALLAATLVLAPMTRGSQSWLLEGRLQPAEPAKVALVLMLARYFHRNPPSEVRTLRDLVPPGLILGAPVGLILLQRDTGVALLTLLIGCTYLILVRIHWRAWLGVAALAAGVLTLAWFFVFQPYQRSRILDVLDPGRDPLASGYQVNQSMIAIGSGGLFGKGWMQGTQTQLRFLPTQHTDFAFSVLAEEWGFAGGICLLAIYAAFLIWGVQIARNSKDSFGAMLALGIVGIFFWPALMNIAMVVGLAPVIGVPLPFIAYGGSALVSALVAVGLLLNVSMRRYLF